jgi:hypothetical protein
MVTPVFICGAECNIAVTGTASNGTEHWAIFTGAGASVVTSGPATMRSARCFRFQTTGGNSILNHAFATAVASPATVVGRFYVYFATLPSVDTRLWITGPSTALSVAFKQSDSKIYAGGQAGALGATGVAVTTGQWYRIDVKAVLNTTRTCDVSVNGVACGQYSLAGQTASTSTSHQIGVQDLATADMYIDDIIISGTSADFPIGDRNCCRTLPKW